MVRRDTNRTSGTPQVSVVIPTFERPSELQSCVESLLNQTLDANCIEIIIVDDGSSPAAQWKPEGRATGLDNLILIRQSNRGPAAARNRGVAAASAPILAFTDDDCRASSAWLETLLAAHAESPDCLIGGRIQNALQLNIWSEASQYIVDFFYQHHDVVLDKKNRYFCANNISVSREQYLLLGGFDERFILAAGEDREFGMRWAASGGRLKFVPDAVVYHYHHLRLHSYIRQQYHYGKGAGLLRDLSKDGQHSVVEPVSVYGKLLIAPIKQFPPMKSVALTALMFVSQLCIAAGRLVHRCSRAESSRP